MSDEPARAELIFRVGDNTSAVMQSFCGVHGLDASDCGAMFDSMITNFHGNLGTVGAPLARSPVIATMPVLLDPCSWLRFMANDRPVTVVFGAAAQAVAGGGGAGDSLAREAARACAAHGIGAADCAQVRAALEGVRAAREAKHAAARAAYPAFVPPACRPSLMRAHADEARIATAAVAGGVCAEDLAHAGDFKPVPVEQTQQQQQQSELLSTVECGEGDGERSHAATVAGEGVWGGGSMCRLRRLFFFEGRWFFVVADEQRATAAGRGRAREAGRSMLARLRREGVLSLRVDENQDPSTQRVRKQVVEEDKKEAEAAATAAASDAGAAGAVNAALPNALWAGRVSEGSYAFRPAVATLSELRACLAIAAAGAGLGGFGGGAAAAAALVQLCDDASGVQRELATRGAAARLWGELLQGQPADVTAHELPRWRAEQAAVAAAAQRLSGSGSGEGGGGGGGGAAAAYFTVRRPHVLLHRADPHSHYHMLFDAAVPVFGAAASASSGSGFGENEDAGDDLRDVQVVLTDSFGHRPYDDRLQVASRWAPVYADEAHLRLCPPGRWCRMETVLTLDRTLGSQTMVLMCNEAHAARRAVLWPSIRAHLFSGGGGGGGGGAGAALFSAAAEGEAAGGLPAGLLLEREILVPLDSDVDAGAADAAGGGATAAAAAGLLVTVVQRTGSRGFRDVDALVEQLLGFARRPAAGLLPFRLRAEWLAAAAAAGAPGNLRVVVRVAQLELLSLAQQAELLRQPWQFSQERGASLPPPPPPPHRAHIVLATEGTALANLLFAPPELLVSVVGRDPAIPYPVGCFNTRYGRPGTPFPHRCLLRPMPQRIDWLEVEQPSSYNVRPERLRASMHRLLATLVK